MINILHVADKLSIANSSLHGVTRLFSWWLPRFNKDKINVQICSLRSSDKGGEYLIKNGAKVHFLNKSKFDFSTLPALMRLVRTENIDIMHLHGYGAWTFGRIAGKLTHTSCIIHEHMVDDNIPLIQCLADKILSRFTPHAIAISAAVKNFMIKKRSIAESTIKIIENGVPLDQFKSVHNEGRQTEINKWRAKLNIPHGYKIIGTIGRLSAIKGHQYYLQAAQKVLEKYPNVMFLIIGDGELRASLENQAREMGIAKNVLFLGHCDNVVPLLALMNVMVIASLFEGGPITLFEAMAAGCAVIASDTIGLKNCIEDGSNGFLIPPKEPGVLAEKILHLLLHPAVANSIAKKAQEDSLQYDISVTVQLLETYYEQAMHAQ